MKQPSLLKRISRLDVAILILAFGLSAVISQTLLQNVSNRVVKSWMKNPKQSVSKSLHTLTDNSYRFKVESVLTVLRNSSDWQLSNVFLLHESIDAWIMHDPVECINYLCDHGAAGMVNEQLVRDVFITLGSKDLAVVIHQISGLKSSRFKDYAFRCAFEGASATSPALALEQMKTAPSYLQTELLGTLVRTWSAKEPEKAVLGLLADGNSRLFSVRQALQFWQERDPDSAMRFAVNVSNDALHGGKREVCSMLLKLLASKNPALTFDLLNNPDWAPYTTDVYASLFVADSAAAARLIAQRPKGLLAYESILDAVFEVNSKNPALIPALTELIPAQKARSDAYQLVASIKAGRDPKDAAIWATQLSDPLSRQSALTEILDKWIVKSPNQASDFALERLEKNNDGQWMNALVDRILKQDNLSSADTLEWLSQSSPKVKHQLRLWIESKTGANNTLLQQLK